MTRKSTLVCVSVSLVSIQRHLTATYLRTSAFSSSSVHVISWPSSSLRLSWLSDKLTMFFSSAPSWLPDELAMFFSSAIVTDFAGSGHWAKMHAWERADTQ